MLLSGSRFSSSSARSRRSWSVALAPCKKSKKREKEPWPRWLVQKRRRIETVISQLVECYNAKKRWARDRWHLTSRWQKELSHTAVAVYFFCQRVGLSRSFSPAKLAHRVSYAEGQRARRRTVNPDYIESLLVWNERGPSDSVRQWYVDRGFDVTPMRAGLLITGPKARFETALDVDLKDAEPPIQLPIPREVSEHVASFGIPRPRRFVRNTKFSSIH
jgi:hypothetical protein